MTFLCCSMCGKGSEKYLIVCSPVAVNYWNVGILRLFVFRVGSFVVYSFQEFVERAGLLDDSSE